MTKSPLPNFFVIGAVKSGTTALHRFLSLHPEVYMSPIKEPNYFSQSDMRQDLYIANYRNSISCDLEQYLNGPMSKAIHIADVATWGDYIQLFRNVQYECAIGESSNSYLFCPSTAKSIATRIPTAKILAVLRNPIERAWSHYLMNRRIGHTLETDFINEFKSDSNRIPKGWGITHNYLELGMYSDQLTRYYEEFDADQIKVVLYDEFRGSQKDTLNDIFSFLAVATNAGTIVPQIFNQAALPRFQRLNYLLWQSGLTATFKRIAPTVLATVAKKLLFTTSSLPKIDQPERNFLMDIYRDDIGRLSEMLGRDLGHWLVE